MRFCLAAAVCLVLSCGPTEEPIPQTDRADSAGPSGASPAAAAQASGDAPAAAGADRPGRAWGIEEAMGRHSVPGVGIALIRGWEVEWTAGYGVRRAAAAAAAGAAGAAADSVSAETLFQAASISKPVAAAGVLRLVQEGRLHLDEDVAAGLRAWRLPANRFTSSEPVTLRQLLGHTAGVTVHGFPGYARGAELPTLTELLDGTEPANSPPVRVDAVPGSLYRYSGGGYQLVELVVEEMTGEPFDAVMRNLVLLPFGMERSTFRQPLPDSLGGIAAEAHGFDGTPVPGGWHIYPERAAAGLWTTPADLARFLVRLMRAYRGEPGAPLDQETARLMLATEGGSHGLGPMVYGAGNGLRFGHGGSNRGFRAYMLAYPATGDGIVVMTNGDGGDAVIAEIVRNAARDYGWPE